MHYTIIIPSKFVNIYLNLGGVMSILAQCPICGRRQSLKNKKCKCGQNLDTAKKSQRIRYWINYRVDGKQLRESVGFSIVEARDSESKRRSQKAEGRGHEILEKMAEERLTFRDLSDWFLPMEKTRFETEGKKEYPRTKACLKRFNEEFGDCLIRNVGLEDLHNYRAKRKMEGISKRTIDYQIGVAKKMIKTAWYANKVSGRTVKLFDALKKMLHAGENARANARSIDDYLAIYDNLPMHLRYLFDFSLFTGMRPGEIIPIPIGKNTTNGLTRDQLDFKNRMIILKPEDTKTNKRRNIPITREILDILRQIPTNLKSRYVFTYKGKSFHNIRGSIRRACKKAGVPYGMRVKDGFVFRDLRSTCKTLMARAGIDIVYRDALLGHEQRGMDRHYMSPNFEKDLRRSMEQWTLWLACEIENNKNPKKEFVDQTVDQ